jgi:hypothetical protein
MPSPFPGMNPYLEQVELWQDFHLEFLPAMRRQLVPQVGPDYIVKLEEHLYVHDIPPEPRIRIGRSDLSVARPEIGQSGKADMSIGVLEAPARVETPDQDVERVPFLEIRDRLRRELITVVEFLSPSNKRPGDDHEQYLTKRRELFRSRAHLVEIDLSRGGEAMPAKNRPDCDYSILISRVEDRPRADFWPIGLRDRLPRIPIPLRAPDGDAQIDLQELLHRVYESTGYEHYIYNGSPDPPLSPQAAEWARGLIPLKV